MQSRPSSRKFHRSPKIHPQSPQTLPYPNATSSEYMSPTPRNHSDSYDEGQQYEQNQTVIQPSLTTIMQRLAQLQVALRQDKSQRLEELGKMGKMIKEMECKHTAIIYDTEIRYNRFGGKGDGMGLGVYRDGRNQGDNRSIRKVSAYAFEKNLPNASLRNTKKIDPQSNKKAETTETQPIKPLPNENPEKMSQSSLKSIAKTEQIIPQAQNVLTQQKIQQLIDTKLKKSQQQTTTLLTTKISQLTQSLKSTQSNLYTKILSSLPNPTQSLQSHSNQLSTLSNKISSHMIESSSQFQKINYKIQEMYGIINDISNPIRERIEEVDQGLREQFGKIEDIRRLCQEDYREFMSKLGQVQAYCGLKLDAVDRGVGELRERIQQIVEELQVERNRKAHEQIQLDRKNEDERRRQEQAINSTISTKMDGARATLLKQIQFYNKKVQQQVIGSIQKHIAYVQDYLKKVQQKQGFLINKFIDSAEQSTSASPSNPYKSTPHPRITGGIKLTGNEKFVDGISSGPQRVQY